VPIFRLTDDLIFPPPDLAEEDGLLAVGGDLSVKRLLLAYSVGIFPWFSEDSPVLWWSPDPRLVLFPDDLKVTRSLRQTFKKAKFSITMDRAFDTVIRNCARVKRGKEKGTWITAEMIHAYTALHRSGYAHSVEAWSEDRLVGGLYGISLGSVFFGESMFTDQSDASKVAFVSLVNQLREWEFTLIDCQMTTRHLQSFGAREIPRIEFMNVLKEALLVPTRKGKWSQKQNHSSIVP
jgi:leucyl/phenylalanyl-tRNA--protein transferase